MELRYSEKACLLYHNIFDYPLTKEELFRWGAGFKIKDRGFRFNFKNGFYFLKGRDNLLKLRQERAFFSQKKLKIARRGARVLSRVPTIKFIGITGALAMNNAAKNSDIDLIIITRKGFLWTTRFLSLGLLKFLKIPIRKPNDLDEKDKLCLNMWLDESDLTWVKKERNMYTAHEIAQIFPLINKENLYEFFLSKNKWILDFWPNSVKINFKKLRNKKRKMEGFKLLESFFFYLQYFYMKPKITREIVNPTRALFHPNDWGKKVIEKLKS